MKAISVRQPWADLIIQGKKTLDLRTHRVNYRGPLAIHASKTIEKDACERIGVDPQTMTAGAVIGIVELDNVYPIDQNRYKNSLNQHLEHRSFQTGLFGWEFSNPKQFDHPIVFKGGQGIFSVPDILFKGNSNNTQENLVVSDYIAFAWNPDKPFQLQVIPENNGKVPFRLALYHPVIKTQELQHSFYSQKPPKMEKVVELGGQPLQAIAERVLHALRDNNYRPTELTSKRREPFSLDEENGVRLGLLFMTVKPISKMYRIEEISHGLRGMTSEELYYWYSKCTTHPIAERAQKALRVLLSSE